MTYATIIIPVWEYEENTTKVVHVPGSLSTATTLPIPSTSRAYLRALNPEADKAYEYTKPLPKLSYLGKIVQR